MQGKKIIVTAEIPEEFLEDWRRVCHLKEERMSAISTEKTNGQKKKKTPSTHWSKPFRPRRWSRRLRRS